MKLVASLDLNRDGEYCIEALLFRATIDDQLDPQKHCISCTRRELGYRVVDGSVFPTIRGENSFLHLTLQHEAKT